MQLKQNLLLFRYSFIFLIFNLSLSLIIINKANAANYYLSAKGNDSSNGLSPSTAWQSISKLNASFPSIPLGSKICFRRGDTFYGSIIIGKSGTSIDPIVITAYGEGPKPIITGFSTISVWTALGNNIYEATVPFNRMSVNCVILNDILLPIGRYPKLSAANGGYLDFESHSGNGQITDKELSNAPNWTGGEIVIRKNHWVIDRTLITSNAANIINFNPVTTFYKLVDGSGYFIQNHPSTLTQNGDWCYDYSTSKIKIWYAGIPPPVKVSTADELLTILSKNHIKISNISFEGANTKAIKANNVESLSIDSCNINYSGSCAAYLNQLSGDVQFNNNIISNSLNNAVVLRSGRVKDDFFTVRNNNISSTGKIAGMGESGDGKYKALVIESEKGATIEFNTIKKTGYVALEFSGNNILIKNNVIDDYCSVKDDGAGIYTWNGGNPVKQNVNRIITGNIISNGIGNSYGTFDRNATLSGKGRGIYMDNNVNHVEITDNTVFNIKSEGMHHNSPSFLTIKGNTFFNIGSCLDLVRWANDGTRPENGGQDITNINMQNNIFFTLSAEQGACSYSDRNENFPISSSAQERISKIGVIDNNYYHLPNEFGFQYLKNKRLTFSAWKSVTGFEQHGEIIPIIPADQINDRVKFEVNLTKESKTIILDGKYISADHKIYNGSVTLQPFCSVILMKYNPAQ